MEFWIGLSVGMHLGKVIADCLEKFIGAYGLLDSGTVQKIEEVERAEGRIASTVEAVVD